MTMFSWIPLVGLGLRLLDLSLGQLGGGVVLPRHHLCEQGHQALVGEGGQVTGEIGKLVLRLASQGHDAAVLAWLVGP